MNAISPIDVDTGWFEDFDSRIFNVNGASIFARFARPQPGDTRAPLLLLHGFPQSHAMWRRIALVLAPHYLLVMPDLRGYGDSSRKPGLHDHSNYSKRIMAQDMVDVMSALGFESFYLCGHDRGARVSHRMALDHPEKVKKLCTLDIAPTLDMYEGAGMTRPYHEFARAYYHWFHMQQPTPLPEVMMGATHFDTAKAYVHASLGGWGSAGLDYIEPRALAAYERWFCNPESIHAACEDYRASGSIDLVHDRESRARGDKVGCDMLVLWGERAVVCRLFDITALWRAQCKGALTGQGMPCGHFIGEELPEETAELLLAFFA